MSDDKCAETCVAPAPTKPIEEPLPNRVPRVHMPDRSQLDPHPRELESLLPEGHIARIVWGFVIGRDLSALYAQIKAFEGSEGRTAIAPEVLLALWLYATLDNVGSAREVVRLTEESDAYRWICGGVSVNYHTLADFRSQSGETLSELLTQSLASLMSAGVTDLESVAQDGIRVRASAGAASFRRKGKLEELLEVAHKRVQELKQELHDDPAASVRRKQAARLRAVREKQAHIEAALARLPELAEIKRRQGKKLEEARASTTDADATVMKMGDGGFRPAYNIQFSSDTKSMAITGVDVVTTGSDMAQMAPMVEQVDTRCGRAPNNWLVDGGYPAHDQIDAVADRTRVIAPVPKPKAKAKDSKAVADIQTTPALIPQIPDDRYRRKSTDSPAVGDWRERMNTDEARELYKKRAATAECINAQARNRGLQQLPVRGLPKVKAVALLFALAHNLMVILRQAPKLLGIGTGMSAMPAMVA